MIEPLPSGPFGLIYSDPPWSFRTWSDKGKDRSPDGLIDGIERHYPTMSLKDIAQLQVAEVAAKDCILLMWVVDCLLPEALEIGKAWGFKYKTVGFTWAKTTKSDGWFTGMGYWTRANPEQCLLFTRGKPKRVSAAVRQLIVAPRREHSRKPDECYERIEALADGPYLEMFARQKRDGWSSWGNQTERFER